MADNKIRINVEVVTLDVNDNGDTITLPVSDERFVQRLYAYANHVTTEAERLQTIDGTDLTNMVSEDIKFHEMLKTEFDDVFGISSYEKVFGKDIVVGAEYVIDFLNQCMPYISDYTEKRVNKLNKYSASRVGSSL